MDIITERLILLEISKVLCGPVKNFSIKSKHNMYNWKADTMHSNTKVSLNGSIPVGLIAEQRKNYLKVLFRNQNKDYPHTYHPLVKIR